MKYFNHLLVLLNMMYNHNDLIQATICELAEVGAVEGATRRRNVLGNKSSAVFCENQLRIYR